MIVPLLMVPRRVYVFLAFGLLAASQSGNIIRLGDAHPFAIAGWRLLLAMLFFVPLAGRDLRLLTKLSPGGWLAVIGAGVALAGHFFTWIAAVQQTTVANAAIFLSINPVFTAIFSFFFFKERFTPRLLGSIVLGMAGVAVLGWGEISFARDQLLGDGLALICALLFSAYFLLGKKTRRVLPTATYVAGIYGVAAIVSFIAMFAFRLPIADYDGQTWLCFVLMAIGPTIIGHTSFNHALAHLKASWISTATLSEPLLAAIVAYYLWGEGFTIVTVAGYVLIVLSVVLLASSAGESAAGASETGEAVAPSQEPR